jgi:hypothetical protein
MHISLLLEGLKNRQYLGAGRQRRECNIKRYVRETFCTVEKQTDPAATT